MKNPKLALILAGILSVLPSCGKPQQPKPEDFRKSGEVSSIPVDGFGSGVVSLIDADGDRQVDAIKMPMSHSLLYVADGYQNKVADIGSCDKGLTKVMTPEMRESASRVLQGVQDLGYEAARQSYEDSTKPKTQ